MDIQVHSFETKTKETFLSQKCSPMFVEALILSLKGEADKADILLKSKKSVPLNEIYNLYGQISDEEVNNYFNNFFLDLSYSLYKPKKIDDFFVRVALEKLIYDPEFSSELALGAVIELNSELTPQDTSRQQLLKAFYQRNLKILNQYDDQELTEKERALKKGFEWYFEINIEGDCYASHPYLVNSMDGIHIDFIFLMTEKHPIANRRDVENYVSRLAKFPVIMEGVLDSLREREKKQLKTPNFIKSQVIEQIDCFSKENILSADFKQKLGSLEEMGDDEKKRWEAYASYLIEEGIYPAYQKLKAYFESLPDEDPFGSCHMPKGDEYYKWILKKDTSLDLTPQEIHELGLKEVERLEKHLKKESLELIRERTSYNGIENWREKALADFMAVGEKAAPLFNILFEKVLASGLEAKPTAFLHSPVFYIPPSLDKKNPGLIFLNLNNPEKTYSYQFPTLYFHEGIPGHHYQLSLQLEDPSLPLMAKAGLLTNDGFSEGWAVYVEELMWEKGFYKNDPEGEIGFLADALLRASRLVVDTGIHAYGWSIETAASYMREHSCQDEETVISEVQRYFTCPGQACSYKLGQFKIKEGREKWKNIPLKTYHKMVLENGFLPFNALFDHIERQNNG